MKPFYLSIIFGCLLSFITYGQTSQTVDSLQKMLGTPLSHKQKVDTYNLLAEEYCYTDSTKVVLYTSKAIALAQKINYKQGTVDAYYWLGWTKLIKGNYAEAMLLFEHVKQITNNKRGVALALNGIGSVYTQQGNLNKALEAHQQSLTFRQQIGSEKEIAVSYNNLGNVYHLQGQYSKALAMYEQSLKIFMKTNKHTGIASNCTNMGNIYWRQGNYPQALEMHQKALQVFEQTKNKAGVATSYNNLGNIYRRQERYAKAMHMYQQSLALHKQIGSKVGIAKSYANIASIYQAQDNIPQATYYLQQGLKISLKTNNPTNLGHTYLLLGKLYLTQQKDKLAKKYFEKALTLRQSTGAKALSAQAWVNLGLAYYTQKNYTKAKFCLNKGKNIAQKTGNPAILKDAAEYLTKVYQRTNQLAKALESHQMFKYMADSLLNKKNIRQITQLEAQYRFNREKDSIQQVQTQKEATMQANIVREQMARRFQQRIIILILSILGISLLFALFIWRSRQQQRRLNVLLQSQKKDILIKNTTLNKNKEEIRQKAHMIALQRDRLIKVNTTLSKNVQIVGKQKQQLEKTLKRLKDLDSFKEKMTHMIAHDLKNPLCAIVSLSESPLSNIDQQMIHKSGKRMTHLIQNILDNQKLQTPHFKVAYQPINLPDIIRKAIEEVQWLTHNKGVVLTQVNNALLMVKGDSELLLRILVNLLHNAITYTPTSGQVIINYQKVANTIKITISDNGIGIAPENLPHIFEAYHHGTMNKTSTGLGLTFCKLATEAQQGNIGVESILGEGTSFWVKLPQAMSPNTSVSDQKPRESLKHSPLVLSEYDKKRLTPLLDQLRKYPIYQVSKINNLLDQIKEQDFPEAQLWKNEVKKVVFTSNKHRYQELIQL